MEERRIKTTLTVEESQRLIELGVDPKMASTTCINFNGTYAYVSGEDSETVRDCVNGQYYTEECSCFTLTDILSILPKEIIADTIMGEDFPCALTIRWDENRKVWHCAYECLPLPLTVGESPELIDALNSLLIWAIESNHYNPKSEEK